MTRQKQLEQLQKIADAKSDLTLARLAEVNSRIAATEKEKDTLHQRLVQMSKSAMTALEVQALDKYRGWSAANCAELDQKLGQLHEKAAQIKELARLDFGKSQAIKKLLGR